MRDITRDEIRRAFGEETFARGLEYFENGYVEIGVKRNGGGIYRRLWRLIRVRRN